MTEPNKTNEELNEELSTYELKSVSGGIDLGSLGRGTHRFSQWADDYGGSGVQGPEGSGSGMTKGDWEKSKNTNLGPGATFEDLVSS